MNEVTNTERGLRGLPLLITSGRCYFGIHSWTRWGEPKPGLGWTEGIRRPKLFQYRSCCHCNKIAVRAVNHIIPE